ncbi:MAG: phosphotransferase [Gaiellaceae bacterium]
MSVAQIAPDPALPQLPLLLDGEAIAPVLARTLGRGVADARIAYVSYDPGESVLVHYEVTADGEMHDAVVLADAEADLAARAAAPDSVALVRTVDGRTPAQMPLAYDRDLDVLIQWPPLDLALPAFAEPPERLRERIEEAGVATGDGPAQLVHYKPGRRAALRFGDHFVKIYASRGLFERSVHNLRAVEPLPIRTPRCQAAIPDLRIEVQSLVLGTQPKGQQEVAQKAGALLAQLHAAKLDRLRSAPPAYWLKSAVKSARVLAAVVPSLEGRLERFVRELERGMPDDDLVSCHGDFDARQLLELDGDFGLVDFDRMSTAAPALDLASYISFVADHEGLVEAAATLDALAEGYGRRPEGVPWYLAIVLLRRARIPFRRFLDGWPEQIAARVAVAEAALRS